MTITPKPLLLDDQASKNTIFSIMALHAQLRGAIEQQLEELQSLDHKQFASESEYYAREDLNDNILEDLGFNRFDLFPEYIREYATVACQQLNYARSITRIKTAIEQLKNLLATVVESTPAFSTLVELSKSELEILREQLLALIKQIEKDYSLVGVLHKQYCKEYK